MAIANFTHLTLLGRQVSFRDLIFEQQLTALDLPPDFPSNLRSSVKTGLITGFNVFLDQSGELTVSIVHDEQYYDLDQIEILSVV